MIPRPQAPSQQVALLVLVSFLLFVAAGKDVRRNVFSRLNKLRAVPQAEPNTPEVAGLTLTNYVGWGATLLILITLADLPPTQRLATGLSWLLFVGTAISFGIPAFTNITNVTNPKVVVKPAPPVGGHRNQ